MIADTIATLLHTGRSDKVALSAPNRPSLTYADLREHLHLTVTTMNLHGIGHDDRVAIVLPNGPELASAFLGIAAGASAAPLNPACQKDEFNFYLSDLNAKALVVERDSGSPAVVAAKALNIPILELRSDKNDPAGRFSFIGDRIGPAKQDGFTRAKNIGLLLHTSGTTSRPKLVPLSQRNLTSSARNIVHTLKLTGDDRCFNIMPLFHVHGLIAGVLASLAAGGSIFCMPRFQVLEILDWMAEATPTWYTAVPAMHQAILARATRARADRDYASATILGRIHLRFIRASSAPLPPAVMRNLERVFSAPVIESYGMTEAAHQMTSNPLPPAVRKPGSVGLPAGPEIAIMDTKSQLLPAGTAGEVVIRGSNVMAGYENNPDANATAFTSGWFRTGDEGVLDEDGYLTITGRLNEVINRGGERVSPREVDDVLMAHPYVASAATFPIPHPTLGEEIAAAVVAERGVTLTEQALADFLSSRLADFKIPRRFVFVDEVPKSPTGKVQRHHLAAILGLSGGVDRLHASTDISEPTPLEAKLRVLWEKTLGLADKIGLHENFFMLGGDSLQSVELLSLIEKTLGFALPQSVLIEHATIAKLAAYIEKGPFSCVVPIQPKGIRPPFFCVHHAPGEVLVFRNLARHLGNDQPFYGIQAVGLHYRQKPHTRIDDMATHYLREIRKYQPVGPYYLGGYSMGGIVAYEMTQQLKAEGERVALLALLDTYSGPRRLRVVLSQYLRHHWSRFSELRFAESVGYLAHRLRGAAMAGVRPALREGKWLLFNLVSKRISWAEGLLSVAETNALAVHSYRMRPCDCDAVLLKGELGTWDDRAMHEDWKKFILGDLEIRPIRGAHDDIMNEPHVRVLAAELLDCLTISYSRLGTSSAKVDRRT
jgi:acyl-CoA synthetase (AMP-forming)/AMP-acid ligase II/thioesterase domain-containing protein/acyl carrier protein